MGKVSGATIDADSTQESSIQMRRMGSGVDRGEAPTGGPSKRSSTICGSAALTIYMARASATFGAFAALQGDGAVVTWGDADSYGPDVCCPGTQVILDQSGSRAQ